MANLGQSSRASRWSTCQCLLTSTVSPHYKMAHRVGFRTPIYTCVFGRTCQMLSRRLASRTQTKGINSDFEDSSKTGYLPREFTRVETHYNPAALPCSILRLGVFIRFCAPARIPGFGQKLKASKKGSFPKCLISVSAADTEIDHLKTTLKTPRKIMSAKEASKRCPPRIPF